MANQEAVRKDDKRVQRTLSVLKEAFAQLITEKALSQITVSEICDRAQIRRTTFYQHFQDKRELLKWYTQEMQRELYRYTSQAAGEPGTEEWLVSVVGGMLAFLRGNEQTVRVLLKSGEKGRLLMEGFLRTSLQGMTKHYLYAADDPRAVAFQTEFCMGGILAVVSWWFTNEEPCSEEEVLQYFRESLRRTGVFSS